MGTEPKPQPHDLPSDDTPWDLPWDPPQPAPTPARMLTSESTVGRPLTRWQRRALPQSTKLLALFTELQTELAALLVDWPRSDDLTGDVDIAFDHREVAWTVICAQRDAAQATWLPVSSIKLQLQTVQAAILGVPTSWTPADTAQFNERPDLFGCDPEAPDRARRGSIYGPYRATPTAPEAA